MGDKNTRGRLNAWSWVTSPDSLQFSKICTVGNCGHTSFWLAAALRRRGEKVRLRRKCNLTKTRRQISKHARKCVAKKRRVSHEMKRKPSTFKDGHISRVHEDEAHLIVIVIWLPSVIWSSWSCKWTQKSTSWRKEKNWMSRKSFLGLCVKY